MSASIGHSQNLQISYDGIKTSADQYSNSEIVTWFNGHDSTTYGDFKTQKYNTLISYGVAEVKGGTPGEKFFFLYADVPLEAKNMIWGSGPTAADWAPYGKALDFSAATGSEKFGFRDSKGGVVFEVDFGSNVSDGGKKDKKGGSSTSNYGLVDFRDSVDYLIGNGISTIASSVARDTKMSIEMRFAVDPVKNAQVIALARNGLDIHLSPDRGLIPQLVPEPSSALLTVFGVLALCLRRRR